MDVGFINPKDPDGFLAAARRAAVLGFEGKWAGSDETVRLANEAFTPSRAAVEKARRIVDLARSNTGARSFELDGKPILMPQVRDAEALLEKARGMGIQ